MANITTQTIRVDLSTDKVIPSAFTHQNDTARTLVFDMYNGGMPYTMTGNTVKFAYKSPIVNGQYSVIAGASMASGTVSGNKVTVTLPVAYTQISGVGMLTMIITPTSGTVRPVNIRLVVQKSADGDDTVLNASDWPEGLYEYMDDWLAENEPTEIANLKNALKSASGQYDYGTFDWTVGGYISYGVVVESPTSPWAYSGFIELKNPKKGVMYITDKENDIANRYNAFYDKNKNYINCFTTNVAADKQEITIPSTAKYVRLSYNSNHISAPSLDYERISTIDVLNDVDSYAEQPSYNYAWNKGGYITTGGSLVTNPSSPWEYTDYIKILNPEKGFIIVSALSDNDSNEYNCFYDENKVFISNFTVSANANAQHITMPARACYVRLSHNSGHGEFVLDFEKISIKDLSDVVYDDKEWVDGCLKQPSYDFTYTRGGYISYGTLIESSGSPWEYTDFIEIINPETGILYASQPLNDAANRYNAFYDDTKTYIKDFTVNAGAANQEITIPSNAKYMRLSCNSNMGDIVVDFKKLNMRELADVVYLHRDHFANLQLPSYYVDHVRTKNAAVNAEMDKHYECVAFVFFTDLHLAANAMNSPSIIKSILDNTSVKDVICGGDVISAYGGSAEILRDEVKYKKAYGFARPYFVRGNHDCYAKAQESATTGTIKGIAEVVNRFIRPYHKDIVTIPGKTYYYFDRPQSRVRFIVIDTSEYIEGVIDPQTGYWQPSYSISQTQINWFISLLKETPADYKIVLCNHLPINSHLGSYSAYTKIFGDIVEAFNNKEAINETDSAGLVANDNFENTNGKIILSICGHSHADYSYVSSSGCVYCEVNDDAYINNGGSPYERVVGTVSEQSFDVVIVDPSTDEIKTFRYGAGIDRSFNEPST